MGDGQPGIAVVMGDRALRESDNTYQEGIRELHRAHGLSLFRYALALTCNAEDAEDAVQDVFVRVAKGWERLGSVRNVTAYLISSTRNAARRIRKARRREDALCEGAAAEILTGCSLDLEAASLESIALRDIFAGLPVDQREVIILKILYEMTFQEISHITGVSINTVAGRYRYGVEKLRRALEGSENG